MDVPIWFDQFLQAGFYLRGWSPKTAVIYRRAFTSFWPSASPPRSDGHGHAALTKPALEAWVVEMRQRGLSPAGCNIYIRTMNAFGLAWRTGLRERACGRSDPRAAGAAGDLLRSEVRAILSHRPKGFNQVRLWTLLNVLVDTGVRIDEAPDVSGRPDRLRQSAVHGRGQGQQAAEDPVLAGSSQSALSVSATRA